MMASLKMHTLVRFEVCRKWRLSSGSWRREVLRYDSNVSEINAASNFSVK